MDRVRWWLVAVLLAVLLSWTDNSDNEEGFNVYRQLVGGAFESIGQTATDVATFTDPAAVAGACYRVTAFNISGESGPSNTVCLPLLPAPPSGLQRKAVK